VTPLLLGSSFVSSSVVCSLLHRVLDLRLGLGLFMGFCSCLLGLGFLVGFGCLGFGFVRALLYITCVRRDALRFLIKLFLIIKKKKKKIEKKLDVRKLIWKGTLHIYELMPYCQSPHLNLSIDKEFYFLFFQ
jgi:hypothetical protein